MDIENFFPVDTPEKAYSLGLLWADGYLIESSGYYRIGIETVEADMVDFEPILRKLGYWAGFCRQRPNRQPQKSLSCYGVKLFKYLTSLGYKSKSGASAYRILKEIPLNLQHYWFRGLFDGDGCLYVGAQCVQLSISSSFSQDWSFLTKLLKKLDVAHTLVRRGYNKNSHRYSLVRSSRKEHIKKFLSYIYQGEQFGLQRKRNKAYQANLLDFS